MKLPVILVALLGAALAQAETRAAPIYIQPITAGDIAPAPLAEISYDTASMSASPSSEVASYELPELPEDASLVRIGVYDPAAKRWASSTSVASAETFSKGYSPHFVLSLDARGNYLGVSLRGVRIDAGQTRDFGPQSIVLAAGKGKQPELNKPVVLSPGGRKVVEEEKSFLQKYWWVLAAGAFLLISGGGGGGGDGK